jgi:hypothetical protein
MIGYLLESAIFFGIGLLIGWNLLPQPEWVKNLWDKVVAKIKNLSNK